MKKKKGKTDKRDTSWPLFLGKIGLALVVFGAPLAWTRSVYSIYTLPKFLILSLGLLVSWSAVLMQRETRGNPGKILTRMFIAAWIIMVASTVGSVDPYLSIFGRYNDYAYGLLAMSLYTGAFYWGARMTGEERNLFSLWAVCAAGLVGLFGVMQILGIRPLLQFTLPGGRAVSTIGGPVHLGAYLALILPLAIPLAGEARRPLRWLCLAGIIGGLIASFSRGAWIAALVGICVFLSQKLFSIPSKKNRSLGLLAVGGFVVVLAAGFLFSRYRSSGDSDILRMEAWQASVSMISKRPVLGSGPDTFGVEFRKVKSAKFVKVGGAGLRHEHAHNDFLQFATTMGLLGLLAYLGLLIGFGLEFARRWTQATALGQKQALRFTGAAAAVFFAAKFNPMSSEILFIGAMVAGAALASLDIPEENSSKENLIRAVGVWIAAVVVCGGAFWLFRADYYSQQARLNTGVKSLNAHQKASRLNPCETQYARRYANTLLDIARANAKRPERFEYLDSASDAITRTLGCRSDAIEAHYMGGFVALIEAQLGHPYKIAVAKRELDRAIELDPTYIPVLMARAATARTAGNPVLAAELEARAVSLKRIPK